MLERFVEAVRAFHRALTISPQSIDANLSIATTYLCLEKFDSALVFAEKAVVLDPQSGAAHSNLGAIYEIELLADEATLVAFGERAVFPAFGVLGGGAGAPNRLVYDQDECVREYVLSARWESTPCDVTTHVAEGNCVIVRWGGEQPEANGQPVG